MLRYNPVYIKELKISVRTMKTSMIIFSYNLVLSLIGLFVFYISFETKHKLNGTIDYKNMINLYAVLSAIEFALIVIIVPAITSSAISGERERQTLDILLTTRLTPMQIIWGKLASSISLILLVVVSSLPVLSIVFSIGGLSFLDLFQLMLCIIVTAIYIGSIGLFFSTLFRKTTVSTVATYGTIILLIMGTVGILTAFYFFINIKIEPNAYVDSGSYGIPDIGNLIMVLLVNPAVTLVSLFSNQFKSKDFLKEFLDNYGSCNNFVLENWFVISIIIQLIIALILIFLSAHLLDPMNRKEHIEKKRDKKTKEN